MAKPQPERTGRLEEPKFIRDFDPLSAPQWKPPPKPSPWQRHFELGRQYPRQWMLVSEVRKGGCKARQQIIGMDYSRIRQYLDRYHPLERWQLKQITVAGTHCDRELYLRYLKELTPEADALDRQQRREAYEAKMAKSEAKKARLAKEARDKAREEEAAAQVRIRGRRRPGG